MMATAITGSGTIKANGGAANGSVVNDGAGGAGSWQHPLYSSSGIYGTVKAYAQGGAGGNNEYNVSSGGSAHGPGGGGGGGYIYSNFPLNAASSVSGGIPGTTYGGINYGATAGSAGAISQTITQTQTPAFPMQCVSLPVSFLSVTAAQQNGFATVKWEVTNEINTLAYIVEKSKDGSNFTAIGTRPYSTSGLATNQLAANQYEYTDNNCFAAGGAVYYRIKEVDAKGGYLYSKTVSIQVSGLTGKLSVFPNPASGSATVSFTSATPGAISLRLFDLNGSLLWHVQYQANIGQNAVSIDNIRTLPNGIYILLWFDGIKPEEVKVIINH